MELSHHRITGRSTSSSAPQQEEEEENDQHDHDHHHHHHDLPVDRKPAVVAAAAAAHVEKNKQAAANTTNNNNGSSSRNSRHEDNAVNDNDNDNDDEPQDNAIDDDDDDSNSNNNGGGGLGGGGGDNDNDNDNEEDDDDDDDSESDSDDNSNDDDDHDDEEDQQQQQQQQQDDGLSEYERLREERIRRNQEYLAKLGLLDESSSLKNKNNNNHKPPTTKKRPRPSSSSSEQQQQPQLPRRSSLGRASKAKPIKYNVDKALPLKQLLLPGKNQSKHPNGNTTTTTTTTGSANADGTTDAAAAAAATSSNPNPTTNTDKEKEKKKKKKPRVPLVVYKELKRIAKRRKNNVKRARKQYKHAVHHVQYWQRLQRRYQQESRIHQQQRALAEQRHAERQVLGGKTQEECLQELDQRAIELWEVIRDWEIQLERSERQTQEFRKQQEYHQQQVALERQLEWMDALERFPIAYQETTQHLNAQLLERSPNNDDPPPPRRSQRGTTAEQQQQQPADDAELDAKPAAAAATSTAKRDKHRGRTVAAQEEGEDAKYSQVVHHHHHDDAAAAAANCQSSTLPMARAAAASLRNKMSSSSNNNNNNNMAESIGDDRASSSTTLPAAFAGMAGNSDNTTLQQHLSSSPPPLNVGGWVSPPFSESLDRSWLSREKPPSPSSSSSSFHVLSLPPQVGDLVLYYPGAHKAFLARHADVWATKGTGINNNDNNNNPLRTPLWIQAQQQQQQLQKDLVDSQPPPLLSPTLDSTVSNDASEPTTTKRTKRRGRSSVPSPPSSSSQLKRRRSSRGISKEEQSDETEEGTKETTEPATTPMDEVEEEASIPRRRGRSSQPPMQKELTVDADDSTAKSTRTQQQQQPPQVNDNMTRRRGGRRGRSLADSSSTSTRPDDDFMDLTNGNQVAAGNKDADSNDLSDAIKTTKNDTENDQETSSIGDQGPGSQTQPPAIPWWTNEWIHGIDSELGQYPILCRVEQSHAEFPYDPNLEFKKIDREGNVTWSVPGHKMNAFKAKHGHPMIRLCLQLQPLTPTVPPEWDDARGAPKEEAELSLAPTFSVITFLSTEASPFLVPFAWAYAKTHSMAIGDSVESSWVGNISTTEGNTKGKICEFRPIGSSFGSFRLADKVSCIQGLLSRLSGDDATIATMEEELTIPWSSSSLASKTIFSPEEAAFVLDLLTIFVKDSAANDSDSICPSNGSDNSDGSCSLLNFIRSTLPLYEGVGIRREAFHRKIDYTCGWKLRSTTKKSSRVGFAHHVSSFAKQRLTQGVPHHLERSLRVKLRFAVQTFIESRTESSTFVGLVTEDVAPSYYCAVPVGMHFDRILARLDQNEKHDYCYYTSVDSLLTDVQAILDNCMLYNSPDSPLVAECSNLVMALKKQIFSVFLKHQEERNTEILVALDRKQLGLVLETTGATGSTSAPSKKVTSIPYNVNTPYLGPLNRKWLNTILPDSTSDGGSPILNESSKKKERSSETFWIPQSGDSVLYSRSLHSSFVANHQTRLSPDQCALPTFDVDDSDTAPSVAQLDACWLQATVVSVHVTFPAEKEDDKENYSEAPLPVLAIQLRFPYRWARGCLHIVCWHHEPVSFLRPAWENHPSIPGHIENDSVLVEASENTTGPPLRRGIDADSIRSISRCFDILKRRCISGTEPDYVDPRIRLENAHSLTLPTTANMSSRTLPSFEDLLLSGDQDQSDAKAVSTRGIRRTEDDPAIRRLATTFYLPPWAVDTIEEENGKRKHTGLSNYETMMPFPTLSLELVRLRLKNGYYRQPAAIINDLQKAYLASTLFLLSGPASRKKKKVSMHKIASYLNGSKGNDPLSEHGTAFVEDDSLGSWTEEERSLISKIEVARKLYAMAILSVSETRHVEKLFGLAARQSSRAANEVSMSAELGSITDNEELQAAARQIRYLLAATGREPCLNGFPDLGAMKLKLTVNGETVKVKDRSTDQMMNHIALRFNDYNFNDALARVVLRRPGRRVPCVRCQVGNKTFYSCRVLHSHSNPDFDFVENWKNVGGIDGLLAPFKAAAQASGGDSPFRTVGDRGPNSPPGGHLQNKEDGALKDPSEDLARARQALKTAAFLSKQAVALDCARAQLGWNFVQANFPIDPSDGHYLWCTICGLSGDVLCCDGCSNVVHTKCVGLSAIPEDDWFCEKCALKRASEANQLAHDQCSNTVAGPPDQSMVVPLVDGSSKNANGADAVKSPSSRDESEPKGNGVVDPPSTKGSAAPEIDTTAANPAPPTGPDVVEATVPPKPKPVLTDDEFEEQAKSLEALLEELLEIRFQKEFPPPATFPIGTAFSKLFPEIGEFNGKVVSTPSEDPPQAFYHAEYEDGDSEDLEYDELLELWQKFQRKAFRSRTESSSQSQQLKRKHSSEIDASSSGISADPTKKRGRGRPRKYPLKNAEEDAGISTGTSGPLVRRSAGPPAVVGVDSETKKSSAKANLGEKKRGRPRKNSNLNVATDSAREQPIVVEKAKGGAAKVIRPRKDAPISDPVAAKAKKIKKGSSLDKTNSKKRGRPTTIQTSIGLVETDVGIATLMIKKPGRPSKKNGATTSSSVRVKVTFSDEGNAPASSRPRTAGALEREQPAGPSSGPRKKVSDPAGAKAKKIKKGSSLDKTNSKKRGRPTTIQTSIGLVETDVGIATLMIKKPGRPSKKNGATTSSSVRVKVTFSDEGNAPASSRPRTAGALEREQPAGPSSGPRKKVSDPAGAKAKKIKKGSSLDKTNSKKRGRPTTIQTSIGLVETDVGIATLMIKKPGRPSKKNGVTTSSSVRVKVTFSDEGNNRDGSPGTAGALEMEQPAEKKVRRPSAASTQQTLLDDGSFQGTKAGRNKRKSLTSNSSLSDEKTSTQKRRRVTKDETSPTSIITIEDDGVGDGATDDDSKKRRGRSSSLKRDPQQESKSSLDNSTFRRSRRSTTS